MSELKEALKNVIRFEPGKEYTYSISKDYQKPIICTKRTKRYASFKFSENGEEIRRRIRIMPRGLSLEEKEEYTEIAFINRHCVFADWKW